MSEKILIANWKMNLTWKSQEALAKEYKKRLKKIKNLEIAVAPSFIFLTEIAKIFRGSNIQISAQDAATEEKGAFTGEVSAVTLKEVGCRYAIVGHSERRVKLGETSAMIKQKLNQCYGAGLIPIFCIGETSEERLRGETETVLIKQICDGMAKVSGLPEAELVIAYEPVWAIGRGQFLESAELSPIARLIKRTVSAIYSEQFYNKNVRLVYGGSVNSIIAPSYWNAEYLDGLLIGGASLDVEEFYNIAEEAGFR
jgi:triosephosphate isomerase